MFVGGSFVKIFFARKRARVLRFPVNQWGNFRTLGELDPLMKLIVMETIKKHCLKRNRIIRDMTRLNRPTCSICAREGEVKKKKTQKLQLHHIGETQALRLSS
jgi:hypothetical protein